MQSLDGLRAVSILLVVYGHAMGSFGFPDTRAIHTTIRANSVAHFGVRVFFIISGFLITALLVDEAKKAGRVSLGAFYAKRVFRIFPPYYAYLLAMMVLSAVGCINIPWPDAVRAFTYTVNYSPERVWYVGHAWSLSVEEQFYLVWPVVLRAAGMKRGAWIALAVVASSPVVRVAWALVFSSRDGRLLIAEAFPTVADSIATGCVLALFRSRLHASALYLRVLRSPHLPVVALAAIYLGLWIEGSHAWIGWMAGETALVVSIALLVDRYVRHPDGPVGRVLNWRPLSFIGTVSYSLYLWQQPFLQRAPAGGIVPPWWLQFPHNLICSGAAALASHYLIERPFLRLRDGAMIAGRRKKEDPSPAAMTA